MRETAALVAVSLLIGVGFGRLLAPDGGLLAKQRIEAEVLPLAIDADAVWSSTSGITVSVSDAIAVLEAGDGGPTLAAAPGWLAAYDTALVRMVGLDLPDEARGVQRQYVTALTLSRDAVEVLVRAAAVPPGPRRQDLLTEVARLRRRSEQLLLAARASTDDLVGLRRRVALLPESPAFGDDR